MAMMCQCCIHNLFLLPQVTKINIACLRLNNIFKVAAVAALDLGLLILLNNSGILTENVCGISIFFGPKICKPISWIIICNTPSLSLTVPGRNATFTLTNVVPQNPKLNQNAWRIHETQLTNLFKTKCSKAYVLVGAIPSRDNWIVKNNVKRVNIPDYLWNAYCCVDNNDRPLQSGAATARNTEANQVEELTLEELGEFLNPSYNQKVGELFDNNCKA